MNKGLDIAREEREQSREDWILGGENSVPCIAEIPEDKRKMHLPDGELQFGAEDFMDCATRAPLNILETKFNYLIKNGLISEDNYQFLKNKHYIQNGKVTFSDRFTAINSGTTRTGNSLKAPLQAIRDYGLIPKVMLPAYSSYTWDEYHNEADITTAMYALGQEFSKRFTINYEKVYSPTFHQYAHMLVVGGYAWPNPVDGVYPRTPSTPNHAFMVIQPRYEAFDNYYDNGVTGDWIKTLAGDYSFLSYGYRVYISYEGKPQTSNWLIDIIKLLIKLFQK